ncbi:MAG: hypothetical protein AAF191_07545, partial [Verrucomicrobiota bacterium]
NLANLIKKLRDEFQVPEAPFVVATIGFDGRRMDGLARDVADAQLAVSEETQKYPEFVGNVKTVDTRSFWQDADKSPINQSYHYNQNAETFTLVGEALGQAMVELLPDAPPSRGLVADRTGQAAEFRVYTNQEGKTMDARLLSISEDKRTADIERRDGNVFSVVIANLSLDDQLYLRQWLQPSLEGDAAPAE